MDLLVVFQRRKISGDRAPKSGEAVAKAPEPSRFRIMATDRLQTIAKAVHLLVVDGK